MQEPKGPKNKRCLNTVNEGSIEASIVVPRPRIVKRGLAISGIWGEIHSGGR
jgi:hypothetical protein